MAITAVGFFPGVPYIYGMLVLDTSEGETQRVLFKLLRKDGVASVAVTRENLAVIANVLPIVTTETTGRIDMTEVVWMGSPINFLVVEDGAVVNGLNFSDSIFDRLAVLAVIVKEVASIFLFDRGMACMASSRVSYFVVRASTAF